MCTAKGSRAMQRRRGPCFLAGALLALTISIPAWASNLVVNGGFETTTMGPNLQFDAMTQATGWMSPGNSYNFIFSPGAADTTGASGQFGNVKLWGPGTGSMNGLTATSPAGGNFVAADSAFQVGAISQTINGLTAGQSYTVGFWWAAAQQAGFDGATFDNWAVSLGSQTQTTTVVDMATHGFIPWMHQDFTFTAINSSEVLSFLAEGGPPGVPPFALLDGVTLNAVPEPGSLTLVAAGALGVAGFVRRYHISDKKRS